MSHILDLLRARQERPLQHQKFQDLQFSSKKTLNSLDLKAHFGCVNALSFSNCGTYLASGGDDRRILIWDVSQALDQRPKSRKIMKATHESNIFCIDFDCGNRKLFSGGNDEKLLIHDLKTGEILDIYPHDEPVYCVCAHPESPELLTTACSDGRVQLIDLRAKNEDPTMLQGSSYAFHGVHINPCDSRLLVTANQEDGVTLLDFRKPNKPILKYGDRKLRKRSAMCARFSPDGSKIFALGRRFNPVLYDLAHPKALVEFDHPGYFNSCTMKSGCFGQNFVFSGSDNFAVYGWKIPEFLDQHGNETKYIRRAQLVLHGHRSIVNQVRFNSTYSILGTSGVEKKIKFWCPFNVKRTDIGPEQSNRRLNGPNNLYWMIQASSDFGDDCERESTEENSSMLAFFDSLVQRDMSSGEDTDENNENSDSETVSLDENDLRPEDDIETVIAKKRQVVMNRRVAKRNLSQDSNEDLRLTMQNARDVLLSDNLPDKLIEEPPSDDDETIKENILKDLESDIHFSDDDDSSSNDESKNPVISRKNNENNGLFIKHGNSEGSGINKSEYVRNIVKKSMVNTDDDDTDDSDNEKIIEKNELTENEKVNTPNLSSQPSTSTSEEKPLFKSATKKTNGRNYRKPPK